MASTNGYVAGGPWITPENGMQKIVTLRRRDDMPSGFRELLHIATPPSAESTFIDTLILKHRITILDNKTFQITADFKTPKEIRTISYTSRPRGKGAYGSMNIPGKPQKDYFGAMYISIIARPMKRIYILSMTTAKNLSPHLYISSQIEKK